jgi:hypothetical protein
MMTKQCFGCSVQADNGKGESEMVCRCVMVRCDHYVVRTRTLRGASDRIGKLHKRFAIHFDSDERY